jgi:hypothetical protein
MPTTTDPVLDPLRRKLTQQLLKAAAGRAIFCPSGNVCGGAVLDCRTTVLVTGPTKSGVSCAPCFDHDLELVIRTSGLTREQVLDGIEVDDGREVFPQRRKPARRPQLDPELVAQAELELGLGAGELSGTF